MANKEGKKRSGCRIVLIVLLILVLVLAAIAFIWYKAHKQELEDYMSSTASSATAGEDASEFEVTTTDGQTVKMSELLEGKDALAVVLFATWCGPCEREFPEMNEVYQKYQDKLAMIGLDIDVLDSDESAKEYADSHGFSFPIAYVNAKDLPETYTTNAYPTTLIIDRNGKVGFCRVGSIPDAESFEKIVTTFIGDDYQERQLGYYTFYAVDKKGYIPNVEFSVTSESGTETYNTGEEGAFSLFTDKPEDMEVKVISVPEGYSIDENGETSTGLTSGYVKLPVKKN